MANKQQRSNREAKKPKKEKPKMARSSTVVGMFEKAREGTGEKK